MDYRGEGPVLRAESEALRSGKLGPLIQEATELRSKLEKGEKEKQQLEMRTQASMSENCHLKREKFMAKHRLVEIETTCLVPNAEKLKPVVHQVEIAQAACINEATQESAIAHSLSSAEREKLHASLLSSRTQLLEQVECLRREVIRLQTDARGLASEKGALEADMARLKESLSACQSALEATASERNSLRAEVEVLKARCQKVAKGPPALLCSAAPACGAGSWTHAARCPPIAQVPAHALPRATDPISATSTKYLRKRAKVAGKIADFLPPSRYPSPDITLSAASAGPCVEIQGASSHNVHPRIRLHVEDHDLDLDVVRGVKAAAGDKRKHRPTGFEPTRKDRTQVASKDPALNWADRPVMAAQQRARLASDIAARPSVQAPVEAILLRRSRKVNMGGGQSTEPPGGITGGRDVQLRHKDSSSRVPSATLPGDRASNWDALESGHSQMQSTNPSENKPHSSSKHAPPLLPVHKAPSSVACAPTYCNSTAPDAAQNSCLGLSLVRGPQVAGRGTSASHPYACNSDASESKALASSGHAPPLLPGVGTHSFAGNVPMHNNGDRTAADAARGNGFRCSIVPAPHDAGRELVASRRSGGAAADSRGCVPGTSGTYARVGEVGGRELTAGGSASGHDNSTTGAIEGAQGTGFKYSEVVRGQERSDLAAAACACCRAFYEAVSSWGVGGKYGEPLLQPSCGHQLREPQMETVGPPHVGPQQQQLMQAGSRHRFRYAPPPTPDGFWDLGFNDSLDS